MLSEGGGGGGGGGGGERIKDCFSSSACTCVAIIRGVHMLKQRSSVQPRPYMCQNIKINIDVGGLHGNQFAKNRPAKKS